VYAYVPNAVATSAAAKTTTINDENSSMVGAGVGNVTPLLVTTQSGSIATPVVWGVYESVD